MATIKSEVRVPAARMRSREEAELIIDELVEAIRKFLLLLVDGIWAPAKGRD